MPCKRVMPRQTTMLPGGGSCFAGEIAAKHGDLQQVSGERGPLEARSRSGRVDPVDRSDLGEAENAVWRGVSLWRAPI
ncbi:hypothetical protein NKJ46_27670 [Mesorhizobium sp. M0166]|uniref:hypothetical protein n=1 Tax=Mesorhizobium sp. M0166 TaxID=2956902 RepID=UPI00333CD48E